MKKLYLLAVLSISVLSLKLFSQDLPVEVQLDLLLTETRGHIDNDDWTSAVKSLEEMTQLGVELPAEFHYNFGKALGRAGQPEKSIMELLIYLEKSNGTGRYEKEALDEFLKVRSTKLPARKIDFPSTMDSERQSQLLNASIEYNESNNHAEHLVSDYGQLASMGVTLPKDFPFHYGRSLLETGAYIPSEEQLNKYLSEGGREATHYSEALKLYLRAKKEVDETIAQQKIAEETQKRNQAQREIQAQEALKRKYEQEARQKEIEKEEMRRRIVAAEKIQQLLNDGNSLGMKFVSVPGTDVLFSIWETRVQDYKVYAEDVREVNGFWRAPSTTHKGKPLKNGPLYPVVKVSWEDAKNFCTWLTERERNSGYITKAQEYRLPTDQEWSYAVGVDGYEPETTLKAKYTRQQKLYPWGNEFPPPLGAGNYPDRTLRNTGWGAPFSPNHTIKNYDDGHISASPVGSFTKNQFGLYDMGGNILEMCEDHFINELAPSSLENKNYCVARGASWWFALPEHMESSFRFNIWVGNRDFLTGFRVVLGTNISSNSIAEDEKELTWEESELRSELTNNSVEEIFEPSELDKPPIPLVRVSPVYPPEQKRNRVEAVVSVVLVIDETGSVVKPRIERSTNREFNESALNAVTLWKFEPGIKDGKKVKTRARIPLSFQLKN